MRSSRFGLIVLILVVMATIPLARVFFDRDTVAPSVLVQDLPAGEGRVIRITVRLVLGSMQGLYYQALSQGQTAVEPAFFGSVPVGQPLPTFILHHSQQRGDLVGVAQADHPDQILILHDFSQGQSWPAHDGTESVEELEARGQAMLAQLEVDSISEPLQLLRAQGLRPLPTSPPATQPTPVDR